MAKLKLTNSAIDKLSPGNSECVYWDEAIRGFGVRVKPNGSKSYVVQYRNRTTGRSRRRTIGPVGPIISFAQAKSEAIRLLGDVVRGGDPVADARAHRNSEYMVDLADEYLEHHAKPKKRPQSVRNDVSMLQTIILPHLGKTRVVDVGHRDIQALHNGLRETPYQANRVLSLLSKMFELSIRWGWRPDNPVKGIERFSEEKRQRWLSETELARLTEALDNHHNKLAANAIRLQLLTGARIGEVLTSEWSDFDLDRGTWTKPSHHTKQKRTEYLSLSGATVALLSEMKSNAEDSQPLLFPGRIPGQPIKELKWFWKSIIRAADLPGYRIHDNRHTHASHLVSSGLSLAIVGRLLGHTNPSTTQRYAHLADDPLRSAAEVMAAKLKTRK